MTSPGHVSRKKHRSSDDFPSNIIQPSPNGDRDIGELIVDRGYWSNHPFLSSIADFRARSACSGVYNRIYGQPESTMVCDGKAWKGFRGTDGGEC